MIRRSHRHAACAVAALCSLAGSPAWAGGGAHVVDDDAVETPGTCHLEIWGTRYGSRSGLANLSPACTREAWPDLELGVAVQHTWDSKGHTIAGPALKLHLVSLGQNAGAAIDGSASFDTRTGRLEAASAIVPFTLPIGRKTRFSINLGYSYLRNSAERHSVFWGGQVETQIGRDLTLMAEGFGRASGPAGAQAGLRWTPHGGAIDVDLLAGRYVDGTSPTAITIGLTIRR